MGYKIEHLSGSKSFKTHFMDLQRSVLSKYTDLGHFGSKTKVHMSSEVHECTDINIKATKDIESTNKVAHIIIIKNTYNGP